MSFKGHLLYTHHALYWEDLYSHKVLLSQPIMWQLFYWNIGFHFYQPKTE